MERDLLRELVNSPEQRIRAICEANDRNGDWEGASRNFLLETILRWAADEPDFAGTLGYLLELAP